MKWLRRGRHRANQFSIKVADIRAQLVDEYLPTGQRIGQFQILRNAADGTAFYQWRGVVTVPQSWGPGVMMIAAPDAAVSIPMLDVAR